MTSSRAASPSPGAARLAVLLALSGLGSLVLEVTWTRMLKLVFGSSMLAVSTSLVAYMLGLGVGGLAGGRLARRLRRPLAAYGVAEIGIALLALAVPALIDAAGRLEAPLAAGGPGAVLARFAVVLAILLPPTLLMGATLPLLVAHAVRAPGEFAVRAGLLYGVNTLGAFAGALLTTFAFFPAFGLHRSNLAGAAFDIAAGLAALAFARGGAAPPAEAPPRPAGGRVLRLVYATYAVVGFTALAFEVTWTRTLAMLCGSSVHAFAAMLAAFLVGIGSGSLLARRWAARTHAPALAYGAGLIALGGAASITLFGFRAVPGLLLRLYVAFGATGNALTTAGFVLSLALLLAPTLVLGALFPLAGRLLDDARRAPGESAGMLYFVNTLGAAAGAFVAGFVLVPRAGLGPTIAWMIALDLAAGAVVLLVARTARGLGVAALVAAAVMALATPGWDRETVTRGVYYRPRDAVDVGVAPRPLPGLPADDMPLYRDGVATTISVHRARGGITLRGNGKPEASLTDMSTQVLLGELPAVLGGPWRGKALVVGLASGTTAGSLALHPFERVDVVEIEPAAREAAQLFAPYNQRLLDRPNVRLVFDDGRHLLQTTRERYDVIVSEPSNPWISGVSNLFTREFFAAAHRALAPRGQLCQWVQLYGMDLPALGSILRALSAEFRYVYGFMPSRVYPDLVLLARDRPLGPADLPRFDALPRAVRDDLQRVFVFSEADVASLLQLAPADVAALAAAPGPVNADDTMFVELHVPRVSAAAAAEQQQRIGACDADPLALFEAPGGPPAGADTVGELALSLAVQRGRPAAARRLVEIARSRGGSAAALAAAAVLAGEGQRGAVREVGALLDEAITRDPAAFAPRYLRARALFEGGRRESLRVARDDVEAALAARPGDWRALHLRLRVANALGETATARRDAAELLATPLAPLMPELWADAAFAAAAAGQGDEAVRAMRTYLDARPDSPAQWSVLAGWLTAAGRAAEAREAQANVELARINDLRAAHARARREHLFGSREKARQMLEALLARDPGNADVRADLGR